MSAAVNGNERNPSYDCQWVFDGIGSTAAKVGKLVKWSIIAIPAGAKDNIGNLFREMENSQLVSSIRAYIPGFVSESLCAFNEGMVRDVKWLFNEPKEEDFGFAADLEREEELGPQIAPKSQLTAFSAAASATASELGSVQGVILQKSDVLAAIKKCQFNTAEARRCAQRVALFAMGIIVYSALAIYALHKR